MATVQSQKADSKGSNSKPKAQKADPKAKAEKIDPKVETAKVDPKAETPKADKATPEKPLTMIQAAHRVLVGAKKSMTCLEIVKAMKAKGFWETKTGLTPQNTLNAAINRDIKKGKSQFLKPEKGKYAAAS